MQALSEASLASSIWDHGISMCQPCHLLVRDFGSQASRIQARFAEDTSHRHAGALACRSLEEIRRFGLDFIDCAVI